MQKISKTTNENRNTVAINAIKEINAETASNAKETREEIKEKRKLAKQINKQNRIPKGEENIPNTPGIIIETRNVIKQYANRTQIFTAIKDVNISIAKGDFVAILGPSGSGKSTLLNVLSGLDRATSGEIIINNVNISALKDRYMTKFRRDNVGFIFQSYNLLPTLNVKENARIGQFLQKDKNRRIPLSEVFNDIDMNDQIDKRIDEISGGQQQRVSIARAISKNPSILFADEPTGALDEDTARKVLKIFDNLNKKYQTTIILVTHDVDVAKIAKKIIRVRNNAIQGIEENHNRIELDKLWK